MSVAALLVAAAVAVGACGQGDRSSTAPISPAASAPSAVASAVPATASPVVMPSPSTSAAAALARQFPEPSGPLRLKVTGSAKWDGVPVRHVTYRSGGATVTATLSVPEGDGPFAAVLYAPGVTCRRDMFALDVAALQRAGIAALAVDPPDGREPFVRPITGDPELAAEAHVRYVADLRRGLDVLRSLPEVDPDRLGYVGYSWGGFVGGYLAGLREPVRAYVLTYAGADWVGADPTAAGGFAADPAQAIGAAGPDAAYLFIAGAGDTLFSRQSVARYEREAAGDSRLVWLPGGHGAYWAAPDGAAQIDHRAWLEHRL
ncbi:MAG: alpha/beta hydrolase [Actinobacteria bacterium]|nr:alpha/beta hydrolase [Actinomycetota bacterium]